MRASIYARVSGSRQEQEQTIASQLDQLRTYVQQRGWTLDERHVFADDGVSGARLDRPALEGLRDAVAEGQVDVVVFTCPDRLARSYVHQWVLLEELQKHGVEVAFINRPITATPEDQLLLHMQGAIAEYERSKILERTRRGRLYKARQGEMLLWGTAPFGYRYVRHPDRRGGKAVIEENEAAWVRKMYQWLLDEGLSLARIAERLTHAGVASRHSDHWYRSSVGAILRNPLYAGRAYYNRREYVREIVDRGPGRGKGEVTRERFRPADEWIEIRVPAIVDEETLRRAQEQLKKNKLMSPRRTQPGCYLLRSLVRCGLCGRRMAGGRNRNNRYYHCTSAIDPLNTVGRVGCTQGVIPADVLDTFVWKHLCDLLMDPSTLAQQLAVYREGTAPTGGATDQRVARVQREIDAQKRRLERLLELYEEELVDKETYCERSDALKVRIVGLERERVETERQKDDAERQSRLVQGVETFRSAVQKGIGQASFEDRQRLCRLVIEAVEVNGDDVLVKHILPAVPHAVQ